VLICAPFIAHIALRRFIPVRGFVLWRSTGLRYGSTTWLVGVLASQEQLMMAKL